MTTPTITTAPPRIFIYRPVFYAWVGTKSKGPKTFYSFELQNTFSQIINRGVLPHIDFMFGYQGLIHLVEETLKGQYNDARICFNRHPQHQGEGRIFRHYKKGILQEPYQDPPFGHQYFETLKDTIIQRIIAASHHADQIYHIKDLSTNLKDKFKALKDSQKR